MVIHAINHQTAYNYSEPVSTCHNMAYLLPRASPRHTWLASEVAIRPIPEIILERPDFFGNRALYFAIQRPHRELLVTATARVEITPAPSLDLYPPTAWEAVRAALQRPTNPQLLDASQFRYPSPYITWPTSIQNLVAPSFPPGRPLTQAAIDLTARIHASFIYDTKATNVTTTVTDLLENRRGVCQDLAHVEIACLRSIGLAARYVSGYMRTIPPPGKPRLVGSDASHAWLSVFVPDAGWLDLDPTNDLIPSDDHITVAWGRDYGDVSPLRGVILGGGKHAVRVSVDVEPNPAMLSNPPA